MVKGRYIWHLPHNFSKTKCKLYCLRRVEGGGRSGMGARGAQAAVGDVAELQWFPLLGLKKYICIMQCSKIRGDKLQKPDLSSPIANVLYKHFTYTRLLNIVQFCPENISDHSFIQNKWTSTWGFASLLGKLTIFFTTKQNIGQSLYILFNVRFVQ